MLDKPRIEVVNATSLITNYRYLIDEQKLPVYDIDREGCQLAMPKICRIGQMGVDCGGDHDYRIKNYQDQVGQYAIWLENALKERNEAVMVALDNVFNTAITTGVVISTLALPIPFFTHAHEVRNVILKLFESMNQGGEDGQVDAK